MGGPPMSLLENTGRPPVPQIMKSLAVNIPISPQRPAAISIRTMMPDLHFNRLGLCMLAMLAVCSSARAGGVDFNHDIRPILAENCFRCHGFDSSARKAGLRFDIADGPIAKLKSGNIAIIPGKPGESELLKRITNADQEKI